MLGQWLPLWTVFFFAVRISLEICCASEPNSYIIDVTRSGADIPVNVSGVVSTSRGLVGDTTFAVLPNVKPIHTFAITAAFQMVCTDPTLRIIVFADIGHG
jgi:hypothetical protein